MALKVKQDLEYSLAQFTKEEQQEIVSFLRALQDRHRIERGSIRKWLKEDFFIIPATDLSKLLDTSEQDIQTRTKQGDLPPRQGNWKGRFYDLRVVLRHLWQSKGTGIDVDKELKRQRIIGEDIKNKVRLRKYILKERAEERSVRILNAAMNMIQYAIKKASPQLVGCPTSTEAELVMTGKFREALTMLKEEATNREWTSEISEEPLIEDAVNETEEKPTVKVA
jgi:hypothetical protein